MLVKGTLFYLYITKSRQVGMYKFKVSYFLHSFMYIINKLDSQIDLYIAW